MDIDRAYGLVAGNLAYMPMPYCRWKHRDSQGNTVTHSVYSYRQRFSYIPDTQLRNNLAELRFVLDYYSSINALLAPGLTFGWHQKLVMLQIIAAICEGIIFSACNFRFEADGASSILWREKKNQPNIGMGYLIEKAGYLELYEPAEIEWLNHLKFARNTIHPRSLNDERARWDTNPVLGTPIDISIQKLDEFIDINRHVYRPNG